MGFSDGHMLFILRYGDKMTLQKPKRLELPKYLKWVKKRDCCLFLPGCLRHGGDAHHVKSVGSGGHDNYAIPTCRVCHTLIQNATEKQYEQWGMSETYPYRMAIETFAQYLLEHGKGIK